MTITIHYRYFENDLLVGEFPVETFDPREPALIPAIGDTFLLYPPAEGSGKVIAVEEEIKADSNGIDEIRTVTIKFERVQSTRN